MAIEAGDVVQLNPDSDLGRMYGPQLVIVSDVKAWGFQGYFVHSTARGQFGAAYLRVESGTFEPIGRAVWTIGQRPAAAP